MSRRPMRQLFEKDLQVLRQINDCLQPLTEEASQVQRLLENNYIVRNKQGYQVTLKGQALLFLRDDSKIEQRYIMMRLYRAEILDEIYPPHHLTDVDALRCLLKEGYIEPYSVSYRLSDAGVEIWELLVSENSTMKRGRINTKQILVSELRAERSA